MMTHMRIAPIAMRITAAAPGRVVASTRRRSN
jgi:hypothetical protein